MATDEIIRCEENDPNRCQQVNSMGQCRNLATPGSKYCKAHGYVSPEKENYRNYLLDRWQREITNKARSPEIKSLRDEIGILRLMLEARLNQCKDATDLILSAGVISDLVVKIEKLVSSCHRLEGSMGQLLDKQALIQFADEMISILTKLITDQTLLTRISDEMLRLLGSKASNNESVS